MGSGRTKFTHMKETKRGPKARKVFRKRVFIISGQFDGPQPIVYAFLPVEVRPAHCSGMSQGLHLQSYVPLTLGDGDRPLQCLLSSFLVTFVNPKDPAVAGVEASRLVGIDGDQSRGTSNKLGGTGNPET